MFDLEGTLMINKRKPRKIRCVAAASIIILIFSMIFGGFSAKAEDLASADDNYKIQAVYVKQGDSLWNLVQEHCQINGDIRKAVQKVQDINGIKNGDIQTGSIIYIPNII